MLYHDTVLGSISSAVTFDLPRGPVDVHRANPRNRSHLDSAASRLYSTFCLRLVPTSYSAFARWRIPSLYFRHHRHEASSAGGPDC